MADPFAIDLDSIDSLATQISSLPQSNEAIENVSIDTLKRGKYQPRQDIDLEKLKELAGSIKSQGVIQPIVARQASGGLEIVAGERRWRAAKMAGLEKIPCVIRSITDQAAMAMALIENIDREDISLTDEALGVANLVKETGAKKAAQILGKPQQWVSKRVKISSAPQFVIDFMRIGYSRDAEGFYLLSRLAESDGEAAQDLIDKWEADPSVRMSLRAQVLDIQGRAKSKPDEDPAAPGDDDLGSNSTNDLETNIDDAGDLSGSTEPVRKKRPGRPLQKQPLPPIVIRSAKKDGDILELDTNEGSMRFELNKKIKALMMTALKD